MKTSLIIAMLVLTATTAQATPLMLGYSAFYKHMAKVEKAKVEQAELGFYLSRTDGEGICTIASGTVRVDDMPRGQVVVLPHGQFVLPYDKQLDLDKAVVELPSPHTGTVLRLHVAADATIFGGDALVTSGSPDEELPEDEAAPVEAPAASASEALRG